MSFHRSHIPSFVHADAKDLMHYFQPQNDRLGLPSSVSPCYKNNVQMHNITRGTWPLNSDAILPQSNCEGISQIPIFTFAKRNLAVPVILS